MIKNLIKKLNKELRKIENEIDTNYVEVERIPSDEAYNLGWYRAWNNIVSSLETIDRNNIIQELYYTENKKGKRVYDKEQMLEEFEEKVDNLKR